MSWKIRPLGILRFLATALSLLLCLFPLIAWFSSRKSQQVIWWTHSDPFHDIHFATIERGKLMLAHYRETSTSPMELKFKSLSASQPINLLRIKEHEDKLQSLEDTPANQVNRSREDTLSQAYRADAAEIESWLAMYRTFYELPVDRGLHIQTVTRLGPNQSPRSANTPANYADNLIHRLEDRSAHVETWQHLGLSHSRGSLPYADFRTIWIPLWLIFPFLLILPIHHAWRLRKHLRRRKLNLCPTCGYDLRATPNLCPECGAVQSKSHP